MTTAARKYYKRGFLNKTEGVAAYAAWVQSFNTNFTYADFTISDCNRQVKLEFEYQDDKQKKLIKHKIDTLIKELSAFREALLK